MKTDLTENDEPHVIGVVLVPVVREASESPKFRVIFT